MMRVYCSTRRVHRSSRVHTVRISPRTLSHSPMVSRGIPSLSTTPSRSKKSPAGSTELVRAPGPPSPTTLPYTELAGPGYELCARCRTQAGPRFFHHFPSPLL